MRPFVPVRHLSHGSLPVSGVLGNTLVARTRVWNSTVLILAFCNLSRMSVNSFFCLLIFFSVVAFVSGQSNPLSVVSQMALVSRSGYAASERHIADRSSIMVVIYIFKVIRIWEIFNINDVGNL